MKNPCSILLVASAVVLLPAQAPQAADEPSWPARVLVTNDNGIDDVALIELARALAKVAETHVVASTTDRSGTSNLISAVRTGGFEVERRDLGSGIEAYALDGYPADCVLFALAGPLRDRLPDLVISGINGGANLGDDWFGSGTIGAARTAAYFGFPAVAVSGLEDDDPQAVAAAVRWVVELVQSDAVRSLRAPQYLTVSLPETRPEKIEGVVVTTRARGLFDGAASPAESETSDGRRTWRLHLELRPDRAPAGSDVAAAMQNRIAIVPMRVDEFDPELSAALRASPGVFPDWSPPQAVSDPGPCPSRLGATITEAEDEAGDEWGVRIVEIVSGGRADEAGLQAGDVLVAMNGAELASDDPLERLLTLLAALDCGDTVTMDYLRDGRRDRVRYEIPAE